MAVSDRKVPSSAGGRLITSGPNSLAGVNGPTGRLLCITGSYRFGSDAGPITGCDGWVMCSLRWPSKKSMIRNTIRNTYIIY